MVDENHSDLILEAENEKRWLILRLKVAEENIKSAFRLFRANGIEPILIKGWAAAREYPDIHQRFFSDIDLCVLPEAYEKSLGIIKSQVGMQLNIDLHCGMRHLDTLNWQELFENSIVVPIDDVPVRILRPEDHLRILCVHWLTDGGANKDRLLDIYYLLKNHSETFDWERCLNNVDINRRVWIITTLASVHRFYPMDTSQIPLDGKLNFIPRWFERALEREWASGTKLKNINFFEKDRAELWKQIKKRLRPNPIQATVLMDGKITSSSFLPVIYQFGSFLLRLKGFLITIIRICWGAMRRENSINE